MPQPTKRILNVYWQIWSGKLPVVLHDGQQSNMTIPEARLFAATKGYSGIRLVPSPIPKKG